MTTPNIPSTPTTAESAPSQITQNITKITDVTCNEIAHILGSTVNIGMRSARTLAAYAESAAATVPGITRSARNITISTAKSAWALLAG